MHLPFPNKTKKKYERKKKKGAVEERRRFSRDIYQSCFWPSSKSHFASDVNRIVLFFLPNITHLPFPNKTKKIGKKEKGAVGERRRFSRDIYQSCLWPSSKSHFASDANRIVLSFPPKHHSSNLPKQNKTKIGKKEKKGAVEEEKIFSRYLPKLPLTQQ
jgi:hypothetical protein